MTWILMIRLTIAMSLTSESGAASSAPHYPKRGVDIGLQLKIPPDTTNDTLHTIQRELEKVIGKGQKSKATLLPQQEEKHQPQRLLLKPAFECDQWDSKTRTCWLDRNTGDTVTFSLSTGVRSRQGRPDVVWKKEFAQRDVTQTKEFVINPNRTSRNLVIGRRGYELRVSPITEIDLDDNQFSAAFSSPGSASKVTFRIRTVPEDLGFVYIGETLDLSIASYVTLPLESMTYHWYTEREGESASLPSNMRVSETGESLRVSELRQEQEGVLACSVYTNKGVHATKKRFLVKELAKNKDVLKSFSDHTIPYQEEQPKYHRRASNYRGRRVTAKVSTPPKTGRDVNDANVEGERYTLVRPFKDGSYNEDEGLEDGSMTFGNASDSETVLNIDLDRDRNAEGEVVSRLLAYCLRDLQCSKHASCARTSLRERGFCKCLPGFYGPGIFCREEM